MRESVFGPYEEPADLDPESWVFFQHVLITGDTETKKKHLVRKLNKPSYLLLVCLSHYEVKQKKRKHWISCKPCMWVLSAVLLQPPMQATAVLVLGEFPVLGGSSLNGHWSRMSSTKGTIREDNGRKESSCTCGSSLSEQAFFKVKLTLNHKCFSHNTSRGECDVWFKNGITFGAVDSSFWEKAT